MPSLHRVMALFSSAAGLLDTGTAQSRSLYVPGWPEELLQMFSSKADCAEDGNVLHRNHFHKSTRIRWCFVSSPNPLRRNGFGLLANRCRIPVGSIRQDIHDPAGHNIHHAPSGRPTSGRDRSTACAMVKKGWGSGQPRDRAAALAFPHPPAGPHRAPRS